MSREALSEISAQLQHYQDAKLGRQAPEPFMTRFSAVLFSDFTVNGPLLPVLKAHATRLTPHATPQN